MTDTPEKIRYKCRHDHEGWYDTPCVHGCNDATPPDCRVILDAKTVGELTAFLVQIEREVKWVRGLLVTEGEKARIRSALDTPDMSEAVAELNRDLAAKALHRELR